VGCDIEMKRRTLQFQAFQKQPLQNQSPSGRLDADLCVFRVVKKNTFRKDTPRVMEINLDAKQVYVWKRQNEGQGSFHVDLEVPILNVVDYATDAKKPSQVTLHYNVPKGDGKFTKKEWKLLFESDGMGKRFCHLLHSTKLPIVSAAMGSAESALSYQPIVKRQKAGGVEAKKFQTATKRLPMTELAQAVHDFWLLSKRRNGWRHSEGPCHDLNRTSPDLVPWSVLSRDRRGLHQSTVNSLIITVLESGFTILNNQSQRDILGNVCREAIQMLDYFSMVVHDNWAVMRKAQGYTWGDPTDSKQKTHTNLKPFFNLDHSLQDRNRHVVMKIFEQSDGRWLFCRVAT
jgi:hypothetical protein